MILSDSKLDHVTPLAQSPAAAPSILPYHGVEGLQWFGSLSPLLHDLLQRLLAQGTPVSLVSIFSLLSTLYSQHLRFLCSLSSNISPPGRWMQKIVVSAQAEKVGSPFLCPFCSITSFTGLHNARNLVHWFKCYSPPETPSQIPGSHVLPAIWASLKPRDIDTKTNHHSLLIHSTLPSQVGTPWESFSWPFHLEKQLLSLSIPFLCFTFLSSTYTSCFYILYISLHINLLSVSPTHTPKCRNLRAGTLS